ncbi:MAG TPA: ABC transporter permease [Streptosporangiaceae bacterium]|jgi:peptide/nickel transport system permease protein
MAQLTIAPTPGGGDGPGGGRRGMRRLLAPIAEAQGLPKWLLWSGIVLTALFVIMAVFAPLIAPYGFAQYQAAGHTFPKQGAPGAGHLFGTTVMQFDVFSRVVYGARTALEVMLLAVIFSLVIGVPLGLLSGYFGGWLDRILVLIMDALFAFPYLLLAIVAAFLLSGLLGGGVVTAALAITVVYIPQYFRVVRNSTLSAREATYVEAARAIGAQPRTIITKYLFSNVVQSVPVIATLNAADAISTLAGLGFLGYGIQPTDAAEWGYDLQRAIDDAGAGIWWTGVYPGIAIVLAVTALTLVGEGLNDVYNPTLRRRRIAKVVLPPRALEQPIEPKGDA